MQSLIHVHRSTVIASSKKKQKNTIQNIFDMMSRKCMSEMLDVCSWNDGVMK